MFDTNLANIINIGRLQIGRNLQKYRLFLGARRHDICEQIIKCGFILQRPQSRSIRRTDIDRQIIGILFHRPHPDHIIGNAILAILVCADIDTHRPRQFLPPKLNEPLSRRRLPIIIKPHPVNYGTVFDKPEQAGAGISGLRNWRQGPNFGKSEPQTQYRRGHLSIFVIARRQTNRTSKYQTRQRLRQYRVHGRGGGQRRHF